MSDTRSPEPGTATPQIAAYRAAGARVIAVAPTRAYVELATALGGEFISFNGGSPLRLNRVDCVAAADVPHHTARS
ncbi:MAG: hypothetical protein D4R84_07620 [Rhodocyclaceae bacterium]|nr:MAG: hypothetical protein D4R84_07620 [Rhodocyclaceae bacterium]